MHEDESRFSGRVTAGATHEMRNVLAIIKESSGLMGDLLSMDPAKDDRPERLKKQIGRIQSQVDRGIGIMSALNRFAHTTDSRDTDVDLLEIITMSVTLAQRFAGQKSAALGVSEDSGPAIVRSDPFRLTMAVFLMVDAALELAPRVDEIVLSCEPREGGGAIVVTVRSRGSEADWASDELGATAAWGEAARLAEALGGVCEVSGGGMEVRFSPAVGRNI